MEQTNPVTQPKYSFKNIIILLFFAFIIAAISSITTYYYLSSKSINQSLVNSQNQDQTNTQTQIKPAQVIITPEVNETEGWKTYINNKYEFTFKYPSEGKINVIENINANKLEGYIISFSSATSQSDLIINLNYASSYNKEGNLFHTNYLDWYVKSYKPPKNCNVNKEIPGTCNYALFYSTLNKADLFSFTFRDNKVINQDITKRIVSSFKFTQ